MTLTDVAIVWGGWKAASERFLGLSSDALHVHVSILLLVFYALATRRRLYHFLPWALVLVTECCNEIIDMNQPYGSVESNWPASRHDIFNTMFLPTVIILLLRWRNRGVLKPPPHR